MRVTENMASTLTPVTQPITSAIAAGSIGVGPSLMQVRIGIGMWGNTFPPLSDIPKIGLHGSFE